MDDDMRLKEIMGVIVQTPLDMILIAFFAVHTKYPLTFTGHGPVLDILSVCFSCFRHWDDSGHPMLHWTCRTPLMWSFCCLYKIPTDLHRSWTRTLFTLFLILGWLWISHAPLGLSMVTSLSLPSCSLYETPQQDTRWSLQGWELYGQNQWRHSSSICSLGIALSFSVLQSKYFPISI